MSDPQANPSLLRAVFSREMLSCLLMGFSSGLPLYVGVQLLPAWARSADLSLSTIGLLSLAGLPYTWKFLWAPLLDRLDPLGWGRRRSWAAITQLGLMAAIASFALVDPATMPWALGGIAVVVAFLSATQDVALDAWRRELLPDRSLGLGNSLFVNAYRLSSLVPGSLALILADHLPWAFVHLATASFMLVGLGATLLLPEPSAPAGAEREARAPLDLDALIAPLRAFFVRHTTQGGVELLVFMLLYKLGDSMATSLLTPFYLDTGFSLTEIGTVAKAASLWSAVLGGTLGGLLMLRVGVNRGLWLFGALQLLSIFGLLGLALIGHSVPALFGAVSLEYLGVGMGTSAFVAFMARSTDKRHTATQLALLSSLVGLPRALAGASAGLIVEQVGYPIFFGGCAALAVPGMLLLLRVAPWGDDPPDPALAPRPHPGVAP